MSLPVSREFGEILVSVGPDADKILNRIMYLRSPDPPLSWSEVMFDLNLDKVSLSRYVWVIVAILRARGLTWVAISEHPFVKGWLQEQTLRHEWKNINLFGKFTIEDYIDEYELQLRRHINHLARVQAQGDADKARAIALDILTSAAAQVKRFEQYVPMAEDPAAFPDDGDFDEDGNPVKRAGKPSVTPKGLMVELAIGKGQRQAMQTAKAAYDLLRLVHGQPTSIAATEEEAGKEARERELASLNKDQLVGKVKMLLGEIEGGDPNEDATIVDIDVDVNDD